MERKTALLAAAVRAVPAGHANMISMVRTKICRGFGCLLFASVLAQAGAFGETGPRPPCGADAFPAFPLVNVPALAVSWSRNSFGRDWSPPACTGWTATGFTTLVTTVARFHHDPDTENMLRNIGAISGLTGLRYWSTTHKQWRTLIVEAHALTGPASGARRGDFTPDELKTGAVVYFEQDDNLTGRGTFRLHMAEVSAERIVYDIENTSTLRYLLVPFAHAGETQSVCFLEHESENVWRYYSMVRTGRNTNAVIGGNESSAINRAVAFYRHLTGIPSDQEPPAPR